MKYVKENGIEGVTSLKLGDQKKGVKRRISEIQTKQKLKGEAQDKER